MNIQERKIGVLLILLGIVLVVLNYTSSPNEIYDEYNNLMIYRYDQPTFGILIIAIGIFLLLYVNDSSIKKFVIGITSKIKAFRFSLKNKKIGFAFLSVGILLFCISLNLLDKKSDIQTENFDELKIQDLVVKKEEVVADSALLNSKKRALSESDLREQESFNAFLKESIKNKINLVDDPGFRTGKVYSEAQDEILKQGFEKSQAEYQKKFNKDKEENLSSEDIEKMIKNEFDKQK